MQTRHMYIFQPGLTTFTQSVVSSCSKDWKKKKAAICKHTSLIYKTINRNGKELTRGELTVLNVKAAVQNGLEELSFWNAGQKSFDECRN